jgi:N-acetylneuraminic acid mutarotase
MRFSNWQDMCLLITLDGMYCRWSHLGDIRFPRCYATLVEVDNNLYLCGGATRVRGKVSSVKDIDRYSKQCDNWEKVGALNTERHAFGGTAVGKLSCTVTYSNINQ